MLKCYTKGAKGMFRVARVIAAVVVVWLLLGWALYEIWGEWRFVPPLALGGVVGLAGLVLSGKIRRYVGGVALTVVMCGGAVCAAMGLGALWGADVKMSAFLGFVGFFCVGVTGEALRYYRRRRRTGTR